MTGTTLERQGSRQRAIESKVGRFIVDDKTGNVEFVFLTPEKTPDLPEIYEQKAIKAGAAEYRINPRTGERTFNFFAQQQQATPVPENKVAAPQPQPKDAGAAGISVTIPMPEKVKD